MFQHKIKCIHVKLSVDIFDHSKKNNQSQRACFILPASARDYILKFVLKHPNIFRVTTTLKIDRQKFNNDTKRKKTYIYESVSVTNLVFYF